MKRYISEIIDKDWDLQKMIFIGGPRQVGKTTYALSLLHNNADESTPGYYNWDDLEHRKRILNYDFSSISKIIILDEIHKYSDWRNFLKGLFDTKKSKYKFIITGSAKLDYYRRGGDSLFGRYFYYRLHPLSPQEIPETKQALENLLIHGGFPEPYYRNDSSFSRRWRNDRLLRVIGEDLIQLERVAELGKINLLASTLSSKIGSLLSKKSLAEDLSVSPNSIENWLSIFEALYFSFRIQPYNPKNLTKALKKEQKLYLWDWAAVQSTAAIKENFIASMLLKYCHFQEDAFGHKMQLCFLRDREKREINFIVTKNQKPIFAVEVKSKQSPFSPHFDYFHKRTDIPHFYQVYFSSENGFENIRKPFTCMNAADFCNKILHLKVQQYT